MSTRPQGDGADATRFAGQAYQSQMAADATRVAEAGYQSLCISSLEPSAAPPERYGPGDTIAGRYDVLTTHSGAMGVVYATFDRELKLPRALKTLQQRFSANARMRELFEQEALVWVQLEKHPFIVRAYLVQKIDGIPYVITEYIRGPEGMGGDLRGWLGHPRLTPAVAAEMALQIAQGMQHTVRRLPGLLHRDLKPANILVDEKGRAMVTDFGLAHSMEEGAGTPAYMAPELWLYGQADHADIYAFGAIVYEMFTGHRLFSAVTVSEWRLAHVGQEPCPLRLLNPALPKEAEVFVLRCLAKDPAMRPANWDEVVDACARLFHQLTGQPAVVDFRAYNLSVLELLQASYSLGQLGKHEEKLSLCERALVLAPTDAHVWLQKGDALLALKRNQDAIAAYRECLANDPTSSGAWNNIGVAELRQNGHQNALQAFRRASELTPNNPLYWNNQGITLSSLASSLFSVAAIPLHGQAVESFRRALEIEPDNIGSHTGIAIALRAAGKLILDDAKKEASDEVIKSLRTERNALALPIRPLAKFEIESKIEQQQTIVEFGKAMDRELAAANETSPWTIGRRVSELALAAYDRVLKLAPGDLKAWAAKVELLDTLTRDKEADQAREQLRRIQDRTNASTAVPATHSDSEPPGFDQRLARWQKAAAANPLDPIPCAQQAELFLASDRYAEALQACDAALSRDPNRAQSWLLRATTLQVLNELDSSVAACDRALELNPGLTEAWNAKARALEMSGRSDDAEKCWDHALSLKAGDVTAGLGKSARLAANGRIQAAIEVLNEVNAANPFDSRVGREAARLFFAAGDAAQAVATCDRALSIQFRDRDTLLIKAEALVVLKRRQEAEAICSQIFSEFQTKPEQELSYCDRVLKLFPKHVPAWRRKTDSLRGLNRQAEAVEACNGLLALTPTDADRWREQALRLLSIGRCQEAVDAVNRGLAAAPRDELLPVYRARALRAMGRRKEAVEAYQKIDWLVRKRELDCDEFLYVADAELAEGRIGTAAGYYKDVTEKGPTDPRGWFGRAKALSRVKHSDIYQGLSAINTLLKMNPDYPGAHKLQRNLMWGCRLYKMRYAIRTLRLGIMEFSEKLTGKLRK